MFFKYHIVQVNGRCYIVSLLSIIEANILFFPRVQMAAKSAGAITVLKDVIANEGPFALWKGFLPTYLKIGPHTVLCFIFMEQLNTLYLKYA